MKKSCSLVAIIVALCFVAGTSFASEKAKGIRLFNGKDLKGWKLRSPERKSWSVVDKELRNESGHGTSGSDIISVRKFGDCELHIEFNVPKGGNSGVYLQGRYEIQVADSQGQNLGRHMCGAIYSKIAPTVNACKPADEWQSFDVVFRQARLNDAGEVAEKARITVKQNDTLIIDDQEIDGVTGGALDNKEGTPGPLLLQGDHSSIKYRNILIRPTGPKGPSPKAEKV
jgi:hypothetical protein